MFDPINIHFKVDSKVPSSLFENLRSNPHDSRQKVYGAYDDFGNLTTITQHDLDKAGLIKVENGIEKGLHGALLIDLDTGEQVLFMPRPEERRFAMLGLDPAMSGKDTGVSAEFSIIDDLDMDEAELKVLATHNTESIRKLSEGFEQACTEGVEAKWSSKDFDPRDLDKILEEFKTYPMHVSPDIRDFSESRLNVYETLFSIYQNIKPTNKNKGEGMLKPTETIQGFDTQKFLDGTEKRVRKEFLRVLEFMGVEGGLITPDHLGLLDVDTDRGSCSIDVRVNGEIVVRSLLRVSVADGVSISIYNILDDDQIASVTWRESNRSSLLKPVQVSNKNSKSKED